MEETTFSITSWLEPVRLAAILRAVFYLAAGVVLSWAVGRGLATAFRARLGPHEHLLLRRAMTWPILALFVMGALHQLGFNPGVLVGAAGVLTVAIGFASQTSASNLVSGLFLIGERPFEVGDVIRVGGTTGEVLSIDLLSVKLRTFDNLFVRIPNESLIKTECTNLTRFEIRRLDLQLSVAYRHDLERVRELLLEVADRNPLSLEEPRPLAMVVAFADSGINLQLSAWTARTNFIELRDGLHRQILLRFAEEGIEIPYPHRTLVAAVGGAPFPVQQATQGPPSGV